MTTEPTLRNWQEYTDGPDWPPRAPFTMGVVAVDGPGDSTLALDCTCRRYLDLGGWVPLDVLNAAAAEHMATHSATIHLLPRTGT